MCCLCPPTLEIKWITHDQHAVVHGDLLCLSSKKLYLFTFWYRVKLLDNVTVLQVETFENHLYKRTHCVEDCDDYVSSRSLLSPAVRQLSSDCLSAFGFSEIIYA